MTWPRVHRVRCLWRTAVRWGKSITNTVDSEEYVFSTRNHGTREHAHLTVDSIKLKIKHKKKLSIRRNVPASLKYLDGLAARFLLLPRHRCHIAISFITCADAQQCCYCEFLLHQIAHAVIEGHACSANKNETKKWLCSNFKCRWGSVQKHISSLLVSTKKKCSSTTILTSMRSLIPLRPK